MPTHFRYAPVAGTSYGLNASEILLADDKDLNEYVGLKKLAPYRKQHATWDAKRGERLREFKKKISGRLEEAGPDDATTEYPADGKHKTKKRKGKKERMREQAARAATEAEVMQEVETKSIDSPRQSIERMKEQSEGSEDVGEDMGITASIEPVKKKRRRQKKSENPLKKAVGCV